MLRAAVRPELFRTPENFSDRPRTIAEHFSAGMREDFTVTSPP
jgi:hypothetical protein